MSLGWLPAAGLAQLSLAPCPHGMLSKAPKPGQPALSREPRSAAAAPATSTLLHVVLARGDLARLTVSPGHLCPTIPGSDQALPSPGTGKEGVAPKQTPSPRSRCPLPSAGVSSFPSQALTSPASARAQRPLMVPAAAARGQDGCLQGREIRQQRDRHVVGTGPCPPTSPTLGHCQQSHQHGADAQPWLQQVLGGQCGPHPLQDPPSAPNPAQAHRASPSIPAFTGQSNPSTQIYSKHPETRRMWCPRAEPGASCTGSPPPREGLAPSCLISWSRLDPGWPEALQVTPTWPPSCLLPATKQGRAAGSRGRAP